MSTTALTITIEYFAKLRDERGVAQETLATTATTPAALYAELRERHALSLHPSHLRVAVNEEFADWQRPLAHGDTVVFIPPVAGG